jgi:hypothetical protein
MTFRSTRKLHRNHCGLAEYRELRCLSQFGSARLDAAAVLSLGACGCIVAEIRSSPCDHKQPRATTYARVTRGTLERLHIFSGGVFGEPMGRCPRAYTRSGRLLDRSTTRCVNLHISREIHVSPLLALAQARQAVIPPSISRCRTGRHDTFIARRGTAPSPCSL